MNKALKYQQFPKNMGIIFQIGEIQLKSWEKLVSRPDSSWVLTVELKKYTGTFIEHDGDLPPIEIITIVETTQPLEQRNEVKIDKRGIYYLAVRSMCNFEVKVYEVTW